MRRLELTDRTRDALRRMTGDLLADPARYIHKAAEELEDGVDANTLRGVRVWQSIMKWVEHPDPHLTLDAERISYLTQNARHYLEHLDGDHATERALAVPMHILHVMQAFEPIPVPLASYLPIGEMAFAPEVPPVERKLRNPSRIVATHLYELLDDRRLHDIFDLSHRDVEAARRAIKRAVHQDNSYTWSLPEDIDQWLQVLVRDAILTSRVNVRFERYDTSVLRRFVQQRDESENESGGITS